MSAQATVSAARSRGAGLLRSVGWPRMNPWQAAIVCVLAALLPLTLSSSFWLGSLTLALIWMVLNMSWNLVLGYSGIWNFGQLAIYAIGGYGAALASERFQLPAVVGLLLGGVAAMLVSLALAIPSLRLRGIYVSLLTFGFAEVVRLLIITDKSGITGGPFGISDFDGFGITSGGVPRARTLYWIALAAVIVTALVMYVLIRSPLGTGLMALEGPLPQSQGSQGCCGACRSCVSGHLPGGCAKRRGRFWSCGGSCCLRAGRLTCRMSPLGGGSCSCRPR